MEWNLNNKVKREKERERKKKKGSRKRRRTLNYLSLRQLFVVAVCGAVGFSGLCPCCPVKPRPIGALNLPGLFPSPGLFSNLNGMDRGVGSTVGGFGTAGSSGSNGSGGFHLDAATPGSVEELRRKAHEHSAALLHSLQQHAMEFHLQQQQHQQQQQQRKNKEANESESNSQSDWTKFFFNQKVKQKKVSYSMALKFLQP